MKASDIAASGIVLGVVMIIIIPLPTWMLDSLLIMNITVSILILLATLFIKEALEFSVLPTLLLITTLFRLALNLSSTKLILGNAGDAGEVIKTFGNFVIGGNLVVGIVAFIIIVAIQFVVITKGAERVSEVAARFTLDAMPGKQMAVDADLNTGAIDEAAAKKRRSDIQREADFYGAMDGASKFVKGDAIISIIVTIVNIAGGLIVGLTMEGMALQQAVSIYTLATVGDGLVSQIPALLISTSTGIIVTRSASEGSFGSDLHKQLLSNPDIMVICGGILLILCLVPGFPKLQFLVLAVALLSGGNYLHGRLKKAEEPVPQETREAELAEEKRKPENVLTLLQVEQLELEFGYGLVPLVDVNLGGDLLDRVVMIRRQCALDLGIILPSIRMRDNVRLGMNEYRIMIKGVEAAKGEVMPDHYLAINSDGVEETIAGIETVEPTFGLPALWITKKQREKAELLGYTTIDPPSVITTHLMEVIKKNGSELMNRQQVKTLMENLAQSQPALAEEVGKLFTYGEIQKVLVRLLRENVPIKNFGTIIEALADYGTVTKNPDDLTEYVRQSLSRIITSRFLAGGDVSVMALDSKIEQLIVERTKRTESGAVTILEPSQLQGIFKSTKEIMDKLDIQGKKPVAVTAPVVRPRFKKLIEQIAPGLTVLSYAEVDQGMELRVENIVRLA